MGSLKLCHCSVTFDTVKAVMGKDIMTLMLVHCSQKALSLVKIFRRQNGATLPRMTHALVTKVTIFILPLKYSNHGPHHVYKETSLWSLIQDVSETNLSLNYILNYLLNHTLVKISIIFCFPWNTK